MMISVKHSLRASLMALIFAFSGSAMATANDNLPAMPKGDEEIVARFKAADTNGDGKITLEEAKAGLPRVAMAWDKIDVENKGYITLEQLLLVSSTNR